MVEHNQGWGREFESRFRSNFTSYLMSNFNRLIALPMMDWTDRHYRYLLRLVSKHMVLYTEMISSQALVW